MDFVPESKNRREWKLVRFADVRFYPKSKISRIYVWRLPILTWPTAEIVEFKCQNFKEFLGYCLAGVLEQKQDKLGTASFRNGILAISEQIHYRINY